LVKGRSSAEERPFVIARDPIDYNRDMRAGATLLFIIALGAAMCGCSGGDKTGSAEPGGSSGGSGGGDKPLVYFSQANSRDPWRQVFDAETKAEAAKHAKDFDFDMASADGDAAKQINEIENAMVKKPKVLLVSPHNESLGAEVDKAHDDGAFVVLLDRKAGEKYDVYVGGDNHAIGFQAGQYMAKRLNGKGTVLMIQGVAAASATTDRASGFMEAMRQSPGITVIAGSNCDYEREKAQKFMETFLASGKPFDAVYAHNDEMAIGAEQAMEAAHAPHKIIVGIDCCQQEVLNMIKDGKLDATFTYPDPGPKGIQVAYDFVTGGQKPKSKLITLSTTLVDKSNAEAWLKEHPGLAK
jgi:ribose transport system substrate-binding protein